MVLAIIALIAVPTIIGIIDKSRKSSLQNSCYGLVEAGNLYNAPYQNYKTVRFDIKDNKVTIVNNKTCTVLENSNVVYLDNEATVDMNIKELISKINQLEQRINELERIKPI